jgi:RHS repeat-associated protein
MRMANIWSSACLLWFGAYVVSARLPRGSDNPSQWNPAGFNSIGPVPGYQSPALTLNANLAQSVGWRGKHMESIGTLHWGARPYEPGSGRFLAHDPVFDSANPGCFSLCSGDPVNYFDPTGRFGKQMGDPTSYQDTLADHVPDYSGAGLASVGITDPLAQQGGDFVDAYNQTQADMQRTLMQGYNEVGAGGDYSAGQGFSSLLNMVPLVGGIKQYIEQGYTGTDLVTGNRVDPMSALGLTASMGLNFASALPFAGGIMSEAAQGARFSAGFADWQAGNVLSWQTRAGEWYGSGQLAAKSTTLRLPTSMAYELPIYQQAADDGILVKVRSSSLPASNARSIWESANGPVPEGFDVDHIIQRQFGGADELSNLQLKPSGLNRSQGTQSMWLNKAQPYGTVFDSVKLVQP